MRPSGITVPLLVTCITILGVKGRSLAQKADPKLQTPILSTSTQGIIHDNIDINTFLSPNSNHEAQIQRRSLVRGKKTPKTSKIDQEKLHQQLEDEAKESRLHLKGELERIESGFKSARLEQKEHDKPEIVDPGTGLSPIKLQYYREAYDATNKAQTELATKLYKSGAKPSAVKSILHDFTKGINSDWPYKIIGARTYFQLGVEPGSNIEESGGADLASKPYIDTLSKEARAQEINAGILSRKLNQILTESEGSVIFPKRLNDHVYGTSIRSVVRDSPFAKDLVI